MTCNGSKSSLTGNEKTPANTGVFEPLQMNAKPCKNHQVPCVGAEHPVDSPKNTAVSGKGGAESGALGALDGYSEASEAVARPADSDPELARLIEAWATLPAPVRAGIVAMVNAAAKDSA